jgi:hypothetical protein
MSTEMNTRVSKQGLTTIEILPNKSSKYDSCTKSGLTIVPRRPLSREPLDRAIRRSGPFNCRSVRALTRPLPVKLENRALANHGLHSTDASAGFVSRASTVRTGLRRHERAPPVDAPGPCAAAWPNWPCPLPLPTWAPVVASLCRGRGRISPARLAPDSGPGWSRRSCRLPRRRWPPLGDAACLREPRRRPRKGSRGS